MFNRLIKNEKDYEEALDRIDRLMDAKAGSVEMDELELLTALVEMYEARHYPISPPNPIDAIKFRMDQLGLNQKDLVPFIGTKSKVSEVLNGKRPLTLAMMRALNKDLGISAEVLLQEPGAAFPEGMQEIEWAKFPLVEMAKRCWISKVENIKERAEELMRDFIALAGKPEALPAAFFRQGRSPRYNSKMDSYALAAWCLRVLALARENPPKARYNKNSTNLDTLRQVARLSYFENGPLLAKEYLEKQGISLIVVPHLPRTYLDGAAMLSPDGAPVIGLTLRYDRIDNFWFCLLHELAHAAKHLSADVPIIVDDLDLRKREGQAEDKIEKEADQMASEALIPGTVWKKQSFQKTPVAMKVLDLAEKLKIHPAIIAGRIRFERKNYRLLSRLLGTGEVKKLFVESCQVCHQMRVGKGNDSIGSRKAV